MIDALGNVFGYVMYGCYIIIGDYGWTIILFTLLTKIIMLPISVVVQKNSIKMVKMYPDMNRIKARCYGSQDLISEEQYQLYKREKYHPMLDIVPVILQLILLMGVVGAFRADIWNRIPNLNMVFVGLDLGVIPSKTMGVSIIIPLMAAVSAWLMCFAQNKINVLQSEQSRVNQIITLLISVVLSLYLGFFVTAGVGLYWTVGNLLSILQLVLLNIWINPQKYINYEELEASKKELEKVNQYSSKAKKEDKNNKYVDLEKRDYKRFLKYGEKQIVFYSEKNGFYKYYQNVIEVILKKTDIVIHYITNDPKDEVFKLASDNFRVYYIGENKLIVLMMKMDADMVVMTTPDLQRYHIKRSLVRDDIEYVYIDHAIGSLNMTLRKHALDHFDTIFVPNDLTIEEIRKQEEYYQLPAKNLVKCGYGLIDNMIERYEKEGKKENNPKIILIAPSWQDGNILDYGIDTILEQLLGKGYHVILRPHPQYVRHFSEKLNMMCEKYAQNSDFTLQTDFSSNSTVFQADVLVTDWSGIAYEYSFTTLKPTLFINTPMKVMNSDYEEIGVTPFDIAIRDKVGISLELDELNQISNTVYTLLNTNDYSKEELKKIREQYLYNIGNSGEVGAKYIINRLIEYSKKE